MISSSSTFKTKLRSIGISSEAIEAAWPQWWSDEAEDSKSAQVELRYSVARRLGLSPSSLLDDQQPVFVWKHEAKFKGLSKYDGTEQSALASFGVMLARHLVRAVPDQGTPKLSEISSAALRKSILKASPFVSLQDLTALCWGVGIPVIHLRVFPLRAKNMTAMAVQSDGRPAILLAKDSSYPAPTAYHLAHEIGHIACQHLESNGAIVDLDEPLEINTSDKEENEADNYAMELLTGSTFPKIEMNAKAASGLELANAVLQSAPERGIEPGTLALCYGYQTEDWKVTYASLAHIYQQKSDVWKFINRYAATQLAFDSLSDENTAYLKAVLGAAQLG